MAILVGDANIFIDMEMGDLIRPMFRLDDVLPRPMCSTGRNSRSIMQNCLGSACALSD